MPTYKIYGANAATGEDTVIKVQAETADEAEAIASHRRVMVSRVVEVEDAEEAVVRSDPPQVATHETPTVQPGHDSRAPTLNVNMPKRSSSLGIVSLILGIVALFLCWIPFVGMISIPIAGLGVLLAVVAFIVALVRQGGGIGWPIGGGLVAVIALLVGISQVAVIGGAAEAFNRAAQEAAAESEAQAAAEQREQTARDAYIRDNLQLHEVEAKYMQSTFERTTPGVQFKVRNAGDRSLDEVEVTVLFKDIHGNVIAEEDFHPVLVSEYNFSGDNKPLKAGYIWQMEAGKFYAAKSVPSEWEEGSVEARITDIRFSDDTGAE